MISFDLVCPTGHEFDGWFRSNDDFDKQNERKLITCPVCGKAPVSKALMAPAVTTGKVREKIAMAASAEQRQLIEKMQEISKHVRDTGEDVAGQFAEEARKIHYGETEARAIYGEANSDDVGELLEEGVPIMPLLPNPEDHN